MYLRLKNFAIILMSPLIIALAIETYTEQGQLQKAIASSESEKAAAKAVPPTHHEAEPSPRLVFIPEGEGNCVVKLWNPSRNSVTQVLSPPSCPEDLFVESKEHAVVITTKTTLQEIRIAPKITVGPLLKLPKPPIKKGNSLARPYLAGYLADGTLAVVLESVYPGDDSDMFVYTHKHDRWKFIEEIYCGRCGDWRPPSFPRLGASGHRWSREHKIWHEKQSENPFVVGRKIRREAVRGDEWTLGALTFKIKGMTSVLSYSTQPGPHRGGTITMGVQLRTPDQEVRILTDEQCETNLVGKHLLLRRFWGKGTEVIDVETGKSVLGRLKLAKWIM